MKVMILLSLATGHVLAENFFFPNTTLPGIPQACASALLAPIQCDDSLQNLTLNFAYPSNATRSALCSSSCAQSLASYVVGTSQACNVSQTYQGVPPAAFGGMAYSMYNQTCLTDQTTGEYCSDFLAGFSTSTDQDGSSLPKTVICSDCVTNWFIQLQGSEYSSYDATFQSQWISIQQQCGTNYNTSLPASPFPSPPAVVANMTVANTTVACPSSQQYTVQPGDNCDVIAKTNNVASRHIVAVNNLASDCSNLMAGVPICLPPLTCTTYTVQSGDSCSSIVISEKMQSITQLLGINPGLFCAGLQASEVICVSPPGGQYTGTTISGATAMQTAVFATATVTPPSTVPYGTTRSCGKWYTVQQYDTCQIILVANQISLNLFLAINPSVNSNCTNLNVGFSYCTLPTANWQTSGSNDTATNQAPPGPNPSGTTNSCYTWHIVVSGDTCSDLEIEFGITFQQMQQWNPQLADDCSNLLLNEAYCMAGPAITNATAAQTVPPPTSTPSAKEKRAVVRPRMVIHEEKGGYPVGWPYPIKR